MANNVIKFKITATYCIVTNWHNWIVFKDFNTFYILVDSKSTNDNYKN